MVTMQKISSHKKTKNGKFKVKEGLGMYVFVFGKGNKRKSITRHCSEEQAKRIKKDLENGVIYQ